MAIFAIYQRGFLYIYLLDGRFLTEKFVVAGRRPLTHWLADFDIGNQQRWENGTVKALSFEALKWLERAGKEFMYHRYLDQHACNIINEYEKRFWSFHTSSSPAHSLTHSLYFSH